MLLETPRLGIRRIAAEDWKSIQGIWEDFKRSEYAQYDQPHDTAEDAVRERAARWAKASQGTDHLYFAVCLHDEMIGYAAFNKRPNGHEIGYCFHSRFHGKGYASESFRALFSYVQGLGLRRVIARTALRNLPSVQMLNGLGFVRSGEERVSFYKDAIGNDIYFDGGIFEREL